MATDERRIKVFVSYARDDAKLVYSLCERLTQDGVDVWLDKDKLIAGQVWEREIRKAVGDSDVVIISHSKKFNQKGYRQQEARIALDEAKLHPHGEIYIIPVRLEGCDILDDLQHLQWVDVFEKDGYDKLLRALHQRAGEIGATLPVKKSGVSEPLFPHAKSEKLVSDSILRNWLSMHSLIANPFGSVDIKTHPIYPVGTTRPDQWEAFLDPAPLFAHCLVSEDAQALSYLLQKECLLLGMDSLMSGVNRCIFPIRVWHQQTIPIQPPLITLTNSAAQAWLDILASNPDALLKLSPVKQKALLELLCWSVGSNKAIIDILYANGLKESEIASSLTRTVIEFRNEFSVTNALHQAILFSWLKVSPFELKQTYLILFGDNLLLATPAWWLEQFNSLISALYLTENSGKLFRAIFHPHMQGFCACLPVYTGCINSRSRLFQSFQYLNGIVTKALASTPLPTLSSLQDITLSWSDIRLKQSINGQFDAAMDPEEISLGKATSFHDLFGPGTLEKETTQKLISASNHSLARLLTLGNRLLQEHCNKAVREKYLSIDELEDILNTA